MLCYFSCKVFEENKFEIPKSVMSPQLKISGCRRSGNSDSALFTVALVYATLLFTVIFLV